jgi:hypothetical protein
MFRIGLGTDTHRLGAEEGVGDRVEEHVGIAVAERRAIVGDRDPAEHEAVARTEAMRVVTETDAKHA